ncbi:MAG: ABC transporter ATP-binding protein [Chloroflexota bacterium]|nr:ABC transporter ATP-binding protein [Chloroflexota bacterium]MDE2931551.1 ABC transporter ATP-binding protein [Chloroflexota bacterium]
MLKINREQLKSFLGEYGRIVPSMRLFIAAAPGHTAVEIVLDLLMATLEPLSVWFMKFLVDAVIAQQVEMAILVALLLVIYRLSSYLSSWAYEIVTPGQIDRLQFALQMRLMEKAVSIQDLTLFESSKFYDQLQTARQATDTWAQRLFMATKNMLAYIVVVVLLFGTLSQLHPLAAVVVFLATIPSYLAYLRTGVESTTVFRSQAPYQRKLDYYAQVLTTQDAAKEVRLFGLGGFFIDSYRELFQQSYKLVQSFRRRQARIVTLLTLISPATAGAVLIYTVWRAALGEIEPGNLVLYVGVIFLVQQTFYRLLQTAGTVHTCQLHVSHLLDFLDLEPQMPVSEGVGKRVPKPLRKGIEVRNVSFTYPGTERKVLENVSFRVGQGESVALVGHNGAGKTTLVKLLCRLYDPAQGAILLDGTDLREHDLGNLRENITAIFQDYARFHLTAAQNISIANLARMDDRSAIVQAAEQGGADEVIARLPKGYDNQLGREFEEGAELSIGEWQKLALARAFFRDAQILILDEPTAALDVQAEYEVYQKFRELTQGRSTILISHRFSTVRMADRIIVLEDGAIAEEGSHAELMAQGGTYADLYSKQASWYRE